MNGAVVSLRQGCESELPLGKAICQDPMQLSTGMLADMQCHP
jgi:hypothetical protein